MKRFIGAICSGTASLFTFILLSLNWLTSKTTVSGELIPASTTSAGVDGWNLISDGENIAGGTLYKLSAILLIIVAILLLTSAVFVILQNLNIIKVKFNFAKMNMILLTIFVILCTLMLIGAHLMADELTGTQSIYESMLTITTTVSFGAWFLIVIATAAWMTAWFTYTEKIKE